MTTQNDADIQEAINLLNTKVGRAITIWSDLESILFMCFTIAIKAENINSLSAAFHSAMTFKTKLDMCDESIKYYLKNEEELLNEWSRIVNRLRKHSKSRAIIAHWPLMVIQYKTYKEPALRPSITNFKATLKHVQKEGDKMPTWNAETVEEKAVIFSKLNKEMWAFMKKLNPSGTLKVPTSDPWVRTVP